VRTYCTRLARPCDRYGPIGFSIKYARGVVRRSGGAVLAPGVPSVGCVAMARARPRATPARQRAQIDRAQRTAPGANNTTREAEQQTRSKQTSQLSVRSAHVRARGLRPLQYSHRELSLLATECAKRKREVLLNEAAETVERWRTEGFFGRRAQAFRNVPRLALPLAPPAQSVARALTSLSPKRARQQPWLGS
jgi:hypothetical protein